MVGLPRVFVARRIPDDGLDLIRDACEMELWDDELPPPREDLLRAVAGCDGILTLLTDKVDDELLDAAGPQLKVVSELRRRLRQRGRAGLHARGASRSATRPAC